MKKFSIIISLWSVFIFFNQVYAEVTNSTNKLLSSLSDKEKKNVEFFLHSFFRNDDFSYTLFGEKPLSFSGISNLESDTSDLRDLFYKINISSHFSIYDAYLTFKTIIKSQSLKSYLFIFDEYPNGDVSIYFINKRAFKKVVSDNLDVFCKELGYVTPDTLLKAIESQEVPFMELIVESVQNCSV